MRKLGMIGGMSWAATETYYHFINLEVQRHAGRMCSGHIILESLNFCDLARLQTPEEWDFAATRLIEAAQLLEQAKATAIIICANSMYRVYDQVQAAVDIPIIHIAECLGQTMKQDGIKRAALIGTRNVMVESFIRQRLIKHGIKLLPPDLERADEIERIIYDELMHGEKRKESERNMKTMLTNIAKEEVEAVVLAATELDMIINTKANVLPIYDSTEIHAHAAANWILGKDGTHG